MNCVGKWSDWSSCNDDEGNKVECGSMGKKTIKYEITTKALNGGKDCNYNKDRVTELPCFRSCDTKEIIENDDIDIIEDEQQEEESLSQDSDMKERIIHLVGILTAVVIVIIFYFIFINLKAK